MTDPRIAPGTLSEVGRINWLIAGIAGRVAGTTPPNLFLTLAKHRRLFRGWLRFAARLMPRGRLPRRESELVILRVAHLRGNRYEFEHHARLGRQVGLRAEHFGAITRSVADGPWSDREAMILAVVDQLHAERNLDDEAWSRLRHHLDER